jgi:hypothetical protein
MGMSVNGGGHRGGVAAWAYPRFGALVIRRMKFQAPNKLKSLQISSAYPILNPVGLPLSNKYSKSYSLNLSHFVDRPLKLNTIQNPSPKFLIAAAAIYIH